MRRSAERAFSMIEVAIAIAVIAILAGMATPLVLKAITQQKEQRARAETKLLFEALFGARDRAVPNMRSDFGYAGAVTLWWATRQPPAGQVRAYAAYPAPNVALAGGWRGPYYNGYTDPTGNPRDPWNNLYQLRSVAGGWQVLCTGANGQNNSAGVGTPAGDDIGYPVPPQPLTNGTVSVNVYKNGGGLLTSSVTATVLSPGATAVTTTTLTPQGGALYRSLAVPCGPAVVFVQAGSPVANQYQAIDLPSAGNVTLNFYFVEP